METFCAYNVVCMLEIRESIWVAEAIDGLRLKFCEVSNFLPIQFKVNCNSSMKDYDETSLVQVK